jgi:hypothetical protein
LPWWCISPRWCCWARGPKRSSRRRYPGHERGETCHPRPSSFRG